MNYFISNVLQFFSSVPRKLFGLPLYKRVFISFKIVLADQSFKAVMREKRFFFYTRYSKVLHQVGISNSLSYLLKMIPKQCNVFSLLNMIYFYQFSYTIDFDASLRHSVSAINPYRLCSMCWIVSCTK